jgi:glyoxylase-like metal-dependent hydrolase (beta-lactamase superfamily II)/8-oxo-dGTP pyrophosphatase MutT (NUDIX family)
MTEPDSTVLPIRPAATVILLRDAASGVEVFLQRRAAGAAFLGGAHVFPGGALDAGDSDPRVLARVVGVRADDANARLALAEGALAYWVAALRECVEEAGILFAVASDGSAAPPERVARMAAQRAALHRGERRLAELLAEHDLALAAGELVYFDHWITPALRPRRFDTRFFVARVPDEQAGSHDNAEAVASVWLPPREALARAERKEIEVAFATRTMLSELAAFETVDAALAHARAKGPIETNRPVIAQGSDGPQIFRRGDGPYAEIHWSDPTETTRTSYDLVPGVPKRLDRHVTRIIAPNPGMMTGPGTNTYLVGEDELAVIDPGPPIASHIAAILEAAGGRIRYILCTHTHRDHSPAALALQAATGARTVGLPPPPGETQDATFAPQWRPAHDEPMAIAGLTLRALHTPGHASNHVCYLLERTRMLFTGDHVMQGSTVVINPPDGDMRAYLRSLEALLARDIAIVAPGHGYLVGAPHREIRRLIEHRLRREARVLEAVEGKPGATLDELVPVVYDDVPAERHRIAARSLLAHLAKLVAEGRVTEAGARFAPAP